jgi:ribokinase
MSAPSDRRVPVVLVVGSINIDRIAEVRAFPGPGETVITDTFRETLGGKGANQAAAAARAGATARMAGRIGADAAAERIRGRLADAGIDTSLVRTATGEPSGIAHITVDRTGENQIVVIPGANGGVTPDDIAALAADLSAADVVVCQGELPVETVEAVLSVSASAGTRVVCNLAPVLAVDPRHLRLADPLVVNEHEASDLAEAIGVTPANAADLVRAATDLHRGLGCPVVVTGGAAGAVVVHDGSAAHVPAPEVEAVRDTVGAGDEFVGVLAARLAGGASLVDAATDAVAAASTRVADTPTAHLATRVH